MYELAKEYKCRRRTYLQPEVYLHLPFEEKMICAATEIYQIELERSFRSMKKFYKALDQKENKVGNPDSHENRFALAV